MWYLVVTLGVLASAAAETDVLWKTVEIKQGSVRGQFHSEEGYYTFYNIPYATAPTGRDKFKAPLAPPSWMQTFDAINRGIVCPQPSFGMNTGKFGIISIQEDCLVANVFLPNTNETNLPVLVSIHGGGYQMGFGNMYPLSTLVQDTEVIVVSFNYRLGPFGFTCLGTMNIPGNAGLKDQLALLRWVKDNIASFGGNPDDVTLTGCSAGAGSIDHLTQSDVAHGLFNKAVIESGFTLGVVGAQIDPVENAKVYARALNFDAVDDINDLEEFYLNARFDLLLSRTIDFFIVGNSSLLFAPCVESDVGVERVITDAPINTLRKGTYSKVPMIFGISANEGLLTSPFFGSWIEGMNTRFSDFLPFDLQFKDEDEKEDVSRVVKEFYFGTQPINESSILSFIDYYTDVNFGFPMLWELSMRVESNNDDIYLHEYSFADENTPLIPNTNVRGVGHCSQQFVILDNDEDNLTDEYRRMRAIKKEYWHNFYVSGKPSVASAEYPVWPTANARRAPHMAFGNNIQLSEGEGILGDRFYFWQAIYEQNYRIPIPPSAALPGTASANAISMIIFISMFVSYFAL